MINTKILLKAMTFMFLPTLSVLLIIFFWFFNIHSFITFITSQETFACFIRIFMMIAEILFVYYMYGHYMEEEKKTNLKKALGIDIDDYVTKDNYTAIRNMFKESYNGSYTYRISTSEDSRAVYIKQICKLD